jgi:hypothetical protein
MMRLNRSTSGDSSSRALHLISAERSRTASSERSASTQARESSEVADVRRQLEDALEDVAFLREQLRAAEAWGMYRVEMLRVRHQTAREIFARNLALLVEELDPQVSAHDPEDDGRFPAETAATGDVERMTGGR